MKVVGYTRVSLDERGQRGLGLAAQRSAIVVEVAARGWELADVLEDRGYSGRDCNRPALTAVMRMLQRREADALLVSKLDRLSRSILDFTSIMATARKQSWGIVALDLAVDTTTPAGEAMANVMATFAQYERRVIAARTSAALSELRSQGRVYSRLPFGWQRDGDRLIPHEQEQKTIARMRRLRARGVHEAIARSLNRSGVPAKRGGPWIKTSVRSVLATADKVGTKTAEVAA